MNVARYMARQWVFLSALWLSSPVDITTAADIAYPSRPIRVLAGIAPGGTVDIIARLYASQLSALLETPVIVENRAGAYQIPAIRGILSANPDGYTLFLTNGSAVAFAPATRHDLPYDPFKDFTYIALVSSTSSALLVATDLPVKTVQDLLSYSRSNPGKLAYASSGTGTASNLKIEYLKGATGLDATHIPYKADADVIRAIQSKTVHFGMVPIQSAKAAIASGSARAIAVTSSAETSQLPGVPGTAKIGIKALEFMEPYSFYGFLGPAGMPKDVVDKLNAAVNKVSAMPDVKARMTGLLAMDMAMKTPGEFRTIAEAEFVKSKELAKLIKE